jgi:hypothetical protein
MTPCHILDEDQRGGQAGHEFHPDGGELDHQPDIGFLWAW